MTARITRKQLKGDEFVSTVDTIMRWLVGNWRPLAAALGVLLVISMIWWAVSSWTGGRSDRASYLLHQAVAAYDAAKGTSEAETGLADAESKLRDVVDRYGRTDQADVARLYLARIELDRGETDSARETFVRLSRTRKGDLIGRLATLDLIALRVASGQGAEVAAELEGMIGGTDPRLPRDAALYQLGLLYIEEQNLDRAREVLGILSEEIPDSPYAGAARQRLGELGAAS